MPAASMLAGMRNRVLEPEVKPQDLPVAPEELQQLKSEIETNEPQARQLVNQIVTQKPQKANVLQTAMYILDASQRLQEIEADPNDLEQVAKQKEILNNRSVIGTKVFDNLVKLEKGELKYNAQTGQLIKELDFFPALVSGVKERTRQLENYKILNLPKDQVIKIM